MLPVCMKVSIPWSSELSNVSRNDKLSLDTQRNNFKEFLSKVSRVLAGTAGQGSLHFDRYSACVKQEKVALGASSPGPVVLRNMSLRGIEYNPCLGVQTFSFLSSSTTICYFAAGLSRFAKLAK